MKSTLKTQIGLLSCLLVTIGCSSHKIRKPAGDGEVVTLKDVLSDMHAANLEVARDFTKCESHYTNIYQNLYHLSGDSAYQDLNNIAAIDQDIEASFLARLEMKDVFGPFVVKSKKDEACLKSASDVLRGLRYVEDYLIEIRMERSGATPEEYASLKGEFPYLLVNPKFAGEFKSASDLKSGDVLLSRGNAYSSAAIARIGRNDYQFSHLSFVYGDESTREMFTTEAHIEIGSVTNPISQHLSDKNAREVVFRHHDPDLAHKASKAIYERVLKEQQTGKTIEYDFGMDLKDDRRLFCSEVISTGFKMVSTDKTMESIPAHKSRFTSGIIPFLQDIGIKATPENIDTLETFSPGDIQFDPRFELVAEWRNPKKMEESRTKDFILTKIFEKMDRDNYRFDPSLKMDVETKGLWLLRRTPLVKKFLEAKFPLNMNPTQMQIFMVLDKVGESIFKEVEVQSLEYNRPMTPKEIYDTVDAFWKKDSELWKRWKKGQDVQKPAFHQYFHP